MITSRLHSLISPASIAVIGVSRKPEAVGRQVWHNVRAGGYAGRVYGVNPEVAELDGQRIYPSVAALPEPVELVVIAVPAAKVPETIAQCGQRGAGAAIVLSAGFAELGPSGLELQQRVVEQARRFGVRVLGPNCLGLMRAPSSLNASFSRGISLPGRLALVSQSGAICSAIVDWAEARQIGFSTVVSLGAAADVGSGELLDYLALDPHTEAILLYLEGVDHARRFMSGLRAAARLKPVIVVKAGRRAAAGRAAASHTGAIVGNDAVFDAAIRRAGAVRVETLHELFSAADVLSHAPRSLGDRLAVITNAGGLGVLAVDRAEDLRIELAALSEATRARLAQLLPPHAAHANPIDILGDAPPERYREVLELCLKDGNIDGVLVLLTPQAMTRPEEVAAAVAACEHDARKPVVTCFMGGNQVAAARALLVRSGVACFDSPEAAVEAFAVLASHRRNQQLLLHVPGPSADAGTLDIAGARRVIEHALEDGRSTLSQLESHAVLRAFGIGCVPAAAARSLEEAARVATELGFPVALKIDSPDITHKTDVDGVRLGIADAAQLGRAYVDLMEQVAKRAPNARIEGVVVEAMLQRAQGRELLVGVSRDPALGPAIAFGAGGTLVEVMHDAAVALPPLSPPLIAELIARTRIARTLGQFRGLAPIDAAALERVLLRVSDLVCELPEVTELDINPLVADPSGALALDARIVVARHDTHAHAPRYAHLAISPFPRHLVQAITLPDGTRLTLRPIRPEDAELEDAFVTDLSFQSKYFRFFRGVGKLTPQMLVRFTQLDYDREMAIIAVAERAGEAGREQELGVARYVADPDGVGGEFAVVVADSWQHKGLGSQLMAALMDAARQSGLTQLHGEVLVENAGMLALMARLGFTIVPHPDDATLRLVTRGLT